MDFECRVLDFSGGERSDLWPSPVLMPCLFPGFRRLRNGFALARLSSTLGYKSPRLQRRLLSRPVAGSGGCRLSAALIMEYWIEAKSETCNICLFIEFCDPSSAWLGLNVGKTPFILFKKLDWESLI